MILNAYDHLNAHGYDGHSNILSSFLSFVELLESHLRVAVCVFLPSSAAKTNRDCKKLSISSKTLDDTLKSCDIGEDEPQILQSKVRW